ncbi:hypothetical protein CI109_100810 [Kwoniella shandongensis]|uniref:Uncharacterized protein n=1 Tax=Kwoniella shandongensis TaxID=1734106 RepID=A0A5M6BPC7_9TREE|nr:uncharacterized protein CI109_006900 [Kwoniella shandongensis]KAA5524746.1 hypothetical protein CI109_006900 [Kwoniella shandongensis]
MSFESTSTINTSSSSKRLRSCLSPTRCRDISPFEMEDSQPKPSSSRSTSFSSHCSSSDGGWKRTKSVRWQEMNGCAVTSFHDTYSHEEYDRTPLEPPSTAERACVLPERGSRCLSVARECFLGDSDEDDGEEHADVISSSQPSLFADGGYSFDGSNTDGLHTPPSTETNSEDGEEDGDEDHQDKEWEECMERRRMMFARMCPIGGMSGEDGDRHPEFEGYRSISATLIQLLKSVGCDDVEVEDQEQRQRDNEDEDEVVERGEVFGSLNIGSFQRCQTENDEEEIEVDTPSLVSLCSTDMESEADCSISSPDGANNDTFTNIPEILTEDVGLLGFTRTSSAIVAGKEQRGRLPRVEEGGF